MSLKLARPDLEAALQKDDSHIKNEVLSMIVQYLEDSGLYASALNLRDEVRHKVARSTLSRKQLVKLRDAITLGNWEEIDQITTDLCMKPTLLYCILRHRFYELLVQGDTVTALQFLATRLKEFQSKEDKPGDFDHLCALLVEASSPSQSTQLPDVELSKQEILKKIDTELGNRAAPYIEKTLPEHRLIDVLQQAVKFQCGDFIPKDPIESLITDFQPSVIPGGRPIKLPIYHTSNVKALTFVPGTNILLSGSSDKSILMWSAASKEKIGELKGHHGRVWALAAKEDCAASASSDGTVKFWTVSLKKEAASFSGHNGDVYSVDIENSRQHIVSGGYDQSVIVWDASTQIPEITLKGHTGAVTSVLFNPDGRTVLSGGNDLTIQLWDVRSYLAIAQLSPVLGSVASLSADSTFTHILAATRDSTNRIWDLRNPDNVMVLKGHQNSTRHFVRAHFGPNDKSVIGGSDDGKIYCWDASNGKVIETLGAHNAGVFDVVWSSHAHCFASCGNDTSVLLWEAKKFE
ncbi:WD repeat protein [Histomonas meleagridis]|uniref:WD repeat protein n=1 Tax=Histomonas meleagridis TaxID=135588 RepID=UPI00355A0214|nr:WD repeat protein [Histomonas meleagridis]KAH0798962.1 WD repeat protein [Histomonas meleagridis]